MNKLTVLCCVKDYAALNTDPCSAVTSNPKFSFLLMHHFITPAKMVLSKFPLIFRKL